MGSTTSQQLNRPFILASVMLGMFLAAIEATIVATAMPSIVADLGGFSMYSWVFSAYLLTNASTVLIFGKLADIFGRKPIYIIGITIFLTGSTLAGFSQSMSMLIAMRFIQGVGAGALMPIATTIVGDIYNREERAKIQGYLSSVWGISAVSGPLLGGFFVDVLNWRYVFWMNIPLGILAMLGIVIFLKENIEKEKERIGYFGSILMMLTVSIVMIILVEGGTGIKWNSALMFILIGISCISLIVLIQQQSRSMDPMIPIELWKYRLIMMANLTSLTTGMITIGVTSYLPAFVQGIMGKSATIAGFTLTTMSIGWPLASMISGRLLLRIGYRNTSLIGGVSLLIGSIFFMLLTPEKGPVWAGIGSFFIGVGMGMTSTAFIVGIQTSVDWEIRGIATSANVFMRSLGSALGVALLGGLLNSIIQSQINEAGLQDDISVDTVNELLDTERSLDISPKAQQILESGLTDGLHIVYIGMFIMATISFIFIYLMPKEE
ncbi:MAG TPA: MDR family MFS transporter [Bacillota bacterium]|nr:MDR family MFS transporter [Bacillota bacterium]